MSDEPLLEIDGLSKVLRSGESVFRLVVPAFALKRGGIYGLTGRSGSGKSTMLDLLALVSRPTSVGRFVISFDHGRTRERIDIADPAVDEAMISRLRAAHFGYVLQSGGLFPYLTVRENILLPSMLSGVSWDESGVRQAVERLDLVDQLDKKPAALSGGQRQRVSILRALVKKPALLLADEPTAAIDEAMAETVMGELRAMALAQGTTVLVVSHDIDFLSRFAEVVIRLTPTRNSAHEVETRCELRFAARAAGAATDPPRAPAPPPGVQPGPMT